MNEATVATGDPGLRLDLGTRGVWQLQVGALFDVCVTYTDDGAPLASFMD